MRSLTKLTAKRTPFSERKVMKRTGVVALALVVLISSPSASACGDKLLRLTRLHRGKTTPVSVVVYARPNSLLQDVATMQMNKAFQSEGHKLTVIKSGRDLEAALQAGVADVLIADVSDASTVPGASRTAPPIVAVAAKADREGLSAAKRFDAVVKAPAKPDNFLDAVDQALESKSNRPKR